jgi:hypothetical protein
MADIWTVGRIRAVLGEEAAALAARRAVRHTPGDEGYLDALEVGHLRAEILQRERRDSEIENLEH